MAISNAKPHVKEDSGTLTVDWTVLTAAIVGLAIVVIASVQAGDQGLASNVGSYFSEHGFF